MNWLIDTCVISELVRPSPDKKVVEWIDSQDEDRLFLSVITFGELEKGISMLDVKAPRQAVRRKNHTHRFRDQPAMGQNRGGIKKRRKTHFDHRFPTRRHRSAAWVEPGDAKYRRFRICELGSV
jgi:predicted nucleic acid-binding protein